MAFDRLLYIDRLKDAGVDETVARAHAEALREALFETVATKDDLRALGVEIDRKFDDADRKIDAVDRKIDTVDRKLDLAVTTLDRKIEITARDVIIKGAGGLIVLASLMIGLKLFG